MAKVYDTATDLITFARGSSGTALRRVGYGDELVTNGDFDTDTDWAKATGWTINTGTGKAEHDGTGGGSQIDQSSSLVAGRLYVLTFDLVVTSGQGVSFRPTKHSAVGQTQFTTSGNKSLHFVSADGGITFAARASFVGSIDNVSVKELFLDRPTDDLVLFNHPDDIPRIEYGSDGSLKGLLIEEQRTNLVTYSEDFSNATWQKVGAATIDSTLVTGPDGTLSGRRVLNFADAAGDRLVEEVSITNATLTGSMWVKGEGDNIGKDIQLTVKRSGGTFAGTSVSHTLTADWVRLNATFTQDPTNTGANIVLVNPANGNEASEVLLYGAQLEAGSFATSYIPTSGSQQTRSADLASIPVSAFGYNQDAGTVVVEYDSVAPNTVTNRRVFALTGAPVGDEQVGVYASTGNFHRGYVVNDGALIGVPIGATGWTENQFYKSALTVDATDATISVDGAAAITDPTGSMPTIDTLSLGSEASNANVLNGHIKSLKYYPRRLTDAQLQELTA